MIQHFVPRVHLKFFAEKVKNEYFVDVYEKETGRIFKTNIKNLCAEKNFYTLEEDQKVDNDTLFIEKIYSDLFEPIYRKAYDILVDRKVTHITRLQHQEILLGVFQVYTRNAKFLNKVISFHERKIRKYCKDAKAKNIKGITYLDEDFSFREFSENEIIKFIKEKTTKEYKKRHLGGTKEICEFHMNAKYEVSEIFDDAEFFTSDNPLIFEDMINKEDFPLLKSKEFVFPLNKKFVLRIFHDNTKRPKYIYRQKIPNGSVASINYDILKNSSRFVIGSKKAFDVFFNLKKILDDTSLELKMDAIKQVLTKIDSTIDTKESRKVMEFYLSKYEKEGTLSKTDEHDFYMKLRELSANQKMNRIK